MEFGYVTQHSVLVRPTGNKGFIVEVGCREFAFTRAVDLLDALTYFFMDPKRAEKEFFEAVGKSGDYLNPTQGRNRHWTLTPHRPYPGEIPPPGGGPSGAGPNLVAARETTDQEERTR